MAGLYISDPWLAFTLRECVEKLNILKTPEERARRLEEIPSIHDDPTMDPDHVSEADTDSDDKKQGLFFHFIESSKL